MTKAFDFVSHSLLLDKMYRYGIRGKQLEWFHSYLSKREQCVVVTKVVKNRKQNFYSSYRENGYGVPQGSVLGPLLFLIYINDLPDGLDHECILFADDTTINIKSGHRQNIEKETNLVLTKVIDWLTKNNLKINLSKTKIIQFQTQQCNILDANINHNNTKISSVESTSFLGIEVDKYCNWKIHVNKICEKLDKFVYVLKRLRNVATEKAAMLAYHGYVSSNIRYGVILWGNSVDADKVFKVQKKCLRSLCGAGYLDSCKPLFKSLRILPFPCLYIYETGVFVKKNIHLFKTNDSVLRTNSRRKHELYTPMQRLALYKRNVYCMSIRIYNKIPDSYKDLPIIVFKKVFFEFLLNKLYYNINDYLNDL